MSKLKKGKKHYLLFGAAITLVANMASPSIFANEVISEEAVLERALKSVGGRKAIMTLDTIQYQTWGQTNFRGQAPEPTDLALHTSTYDGEVISDLSENNHRVNFERDVIYPFNTVQVYSEIVDDGIGAILDNDNAVGVPTPRTMTSDRAAATHKRLRLLNPLILLKEVAEGTRHFSVEFKQTKKGKQRAILVLEDSVAPIRLHLHRNGLVRKLSTREHSYVLGDVSYDVKYNQWLRVPGTRLRFPMSVEVLYDGESGLEERRHTVKVNDSIAPQRLAFPDGIDPILAFNLPEATRGEQTHHFSHEFSSIGIPAADGFQSTVNATELAPGVFYLRGGTHHSMAIEQDNGIVLVEAPLHEERSNALAQWISQQFPDKPISYVVMSHYHFDHSGGIRRFVSEGAKVVLSEHGLGFLEALVTSERTIRPDTLSFNPTTLETVAVADKKRLTLEDSRNPVTLIHHENTPHAVDLLLISLPEQKILFTADVYSPGAELILSEERAPLLKEIDDENIPVEIIAGAHGGTATIERLRALVASEAQ